MTKQLGIQVTSVSLLTKDILLFFSHGKRLNTYLRGQFNFTLHCVLV